MNTKSVHFVSRALAVAMVLCLAVTMLVIPANAADANTPSPRSHIFIYRNYSGSFDEPWEKTYSDSASDGSTDYPMEITYGYNTFLVNEDYCWADSDYPHWAELRNGNGLHEGLLVLGGVTSRVDVTHSGDQISYSCYIS